MTAKGLRVLASGREMRIADIARRIKPVDPGEIATLADAVAIVERLLRED